MEYKVKLLFWCISQFLLVCFLDKEKILLIFKYKAYCLKTFSKVQFFFPTLCKIYQIDCSKKQIALQNLLHHKTKYHVLSYN